MRLRNTLIYFLKSSQNLRKHLLHLYLNENIVRFYSNVMLCHSSSNDAVTKDVKVSCGFILMARTYPPPAIKINFAGSTDNEKVINFHFNCYSIIFNSVHKCHVK